MKQETYIKISNKVRKYTYGEKFVNYFNLFITRIIYVAFLALLIHMAVVKDGRFIRIVLTTGISFILVSIARYFLNGDRPYTKFDFEPIVKKKKVGETMPSRHVFSAFVIGMAFFYIIPILGILVFVDGILMCFGRVIAGVHFPKDVIVGAIIGILSGLIGFYII